MHSTSPTPKLPQLKYNTTVTVSITEGEEEVPEKFGTLWINSGRFYFALDLLLFLGIFSRGVIPSVMTGIRWRRV